MDRSQDKDNNMTRQRALLIDITRCVGCEACTYACKEANNLPDTEETTLSATAFTVLEERGEFYVRKLCRHCADPSCASACPVGAFVKTPEGPVIYDGDKCMGCRYCMIACPFQVPRYEWDKRAPLVRKCIMCHDRIKNGGVTACSEACTEEATIFGYRDDLLALARQRIADNPDDYIHHVYGEKEVGGTNVLFLASVAFAQLGLREDLGDDALPQLTWEALKSVPNILSSGGIALAGLWWLINRRVTVDKLRQQTGQKHPSPVAPNGGPHRERTSK